MRLQVLETPRGWDLLVSWEGSEEQLHVEAGSRADVEEAWCALTNGGLVPWSEIREVSDAE